MKPKKRIESLILTLRGQKVILDADLADLYGVPTKVFNQAVKRNADRFPPDFLFQLTAQEWTSLKLQMTAAGLEVVQKEGVLPNWSQFVTSSKRHRGAAYRPTAFTEHGAIMAATVLNSPEAVAMSVFVVRAFMQMREQLAANAATLCPGSQKVQLHARIAAISDVLMNRSVSSDELPATQKPAQLPRVGVRRQTNSFHNPIIPRFALHSPKFRLSEIFSRGVCKGPAFGFIGGQFQALARDFSCIVQPHDLAPLQVTASVETPKTRNHDHRAIWRDGDTQLL